MLYLSDGSPAFVEIATPSGFGLCNGIAPTPSCTEVGGELILDSFNGDVTYLLSTLGGESSVATLGAFPPHDVEIRFRAEGSYAVYPFASTPSDWTAVRVPFEIWDVGSEPPFTPRDPSDDVQLVPVLFADGGGTCAFDYGEAEVYRRQASDRIYAYYPFQNDYAAFHTAASALIRADPDLCVVGQAAADFSDQFVDYGRGRPIQRQVFVDNTGTGDVGTLQGTTVTFYTAARRPSPPRRG